jgi:hypothetical protein
MTDNILPMVIASISAIASLYLIVKGIMEIMAPNYVSTIGTVNGMCTDVNLSNSLIQCVNVTYTDNTVNKIPHSANLYTSNTYNQGDILTIYYDPNDYSIISENGSSKITGWWQLIAGLVLGFLTASLISQALNCNPLCDIPKTCPKPSALKSLFSSGPQMSPSPLTSLFSSGPQMSPSPLTSLCSSGPQMSPSPLTSLCSSGPQMSPSQQMTPSVPVNQNAQLLKIIENSEDGMINIKDVARVFSESK